MPIRPLHSREVVQRLRRAGFTPIRQKGGHLRLRDDAGHLVTVPMHPRDISTWVIRRIVQQAGLTEEEWDNL